MIDSKTPTFEIPLPNAANLLSDDVLRLIAALTLIDTLIAARPTVSAVDTSIANAVAALVNSSPAALNTLNELAAALGNDPNFATTVTNALAGKLDNSYAATVTAALAGKLDKAGGSITGSLSVAGGIPRRIGTVASAGTITPTGDASDQYNVTALAGAATIAAPSGTPGNGQRLMLRIKDNGTSRALTWTTSAGGYRAMSGVTLPTATTAGKQSYIGCVYNSADGFWDVVAVVTQA